MVATGAGRVGGSVVTLVTLRVVVVAGCVVLVVVGASGDVTVDDLCCLGVPSVGDVVVDVTTPSMSIVEFTVVAVIRSFTARTDGVL